MSKRFRDRASRIDRASPALRRHPERDHWLCFSMAELAVLSGHHRDAEPTKAVDA
jgi:hypothetical protein